MSLYLKHRPSSLEEIKGNSEIVQALQTMLSNKETCPHSFLLHGPTGCGKTTIARIIASGLGCHGADLKEVDSADFRGIDTIREIRRNSSYEPIESTCRVWIIDECHKMTNDAQNALLKILEEPPSHIYFVLCTTEPNKLLSTIKGRCIQFQVKTLNETQLYGLLRRIAREEGASLEKEVYDQIIQDSLGHPRNAIQVLEKVLNVDPEKRLEVAMQTAEQMTDAIELCRVMMRKGTKWKDVATILEKIKDQEAEDIRRLVLAYTQSTLLRGENDVAAAILEAFLEPFYNVGFPGLVYACY